MPSPHEVLGVPVDADREVLDRAYRRRVKEAHPDHGGSAAEFQRVKAAYDRLTGARPGAAWRDVEADRPGEGAGASADGRGAASNGTGTGAGTWAGSGGPFRRTRTGPGAGSSVRSRATRSRVEYLDYEAVADHGWSIDDPDLFERASGADLDHDAYGRFLAEPDESLLEAAENRGFAWPYSCRGGACANCAVRVTCGGMAMPVDHILPEDLTDRGFQLSCVGAAASDELQVVFNVKHLPDLDELLLPARPFDDGVPE